MALVPNGSYPRLPIPHEPGEWIMLRPITVGDSRAIGRDLDDKTALDVHVFFLARALVEWSYIAPITEETINCLDRATFDWMVQEMYAGVRGDEEKKGLNGNSSGITDPAAADSRPSSITF